MPRHERRFADSAAGPPPLPPLASVLPEGLDAAEAAVNRVFDLAAVGENRRRAERVREWLLTLLRSEYAAGVPDDHTRGAVAGYAAQGAEQEDGGRETG